MTRSLKALDSLPLKHSRPPHPRTFYCVFGDETNHAEDVFLERRVRRSARALITETERIHSYTAVEMSGWCVVTRERVYRCGRGAGGRQTGKVYFTLSPWARLFASGYCAFLI